MDFWEYMLARKQGGGGSSGGGGAAEEWFNDGNTHIWISLTEGRKSPKIAEILGNKTGEIITVDWGDGTEPEELTVLSPYVAVKTDVHHYEQAGDYVITLSTSNNDGLRGYGSLYGSLLLTGSGGQYDGDSYAYRGAVRKIELGKNSGTGSQGGNNFCALTEVAFYDDGTGFQADAEIGFPSCHALSKVVLPEGITQVIRYAFESCFSLTEVYVPKSVQTVSPNAFKDCYSLALCDFSNHTSIPTLANSTVFSNLPADCEIRVPAALADEWKATTNWSTYADKIVGV